MLNEITAKLLTGIIRSIIWIYTYSTLPIYYYIQKPWITLERAHETRAKKLDPLDPHSVWKRVGTTPELKQFEVESIDRMLETAVLINGYDYPIVGVKVNLGSKQTYKWFTYRDIIKRIDNIAKGLQSIGVEKGDKVLIFAQTRLEWLLCALAVYRLGGIVTTLFDQLADEGIIHGINQTEVKYAITTKKQLEKLRNILSSIPSLKTVIDIDGLSLNDNLVEIISLKELETKGSKSMTELSHQSLNNGTDIALIMYTSGTTGNPKGVIATHSQMLASFKTILCIMADEIPNLKNHCYVAYLPLGHMFEFMAELLFLGAGVRIGYASALTLAEGSPGLKPGDIPDIQILKPTLFLTVPLVLDRIRSGITKMVESNQIKESIFYTLFNYKDFWRTKGYKSQICNYFLCKTAKQKMGGNIKIMLVGGAPITAETEKFITLVFDVILLQGYGGTEVCGPAHVRDFYDLKFGRTGAPLHGVNARLADWSEGGYLATDKPNPRGEILINGNHVVEGYYMMENETNEAFRYENGEKWYYTGDIGEIESDGCFKIIDRKKDLIKLQNGEYYSLGKIEASVKSCSLIDNICVNGNATHDYLIALVVPNQIAIETMANELGINYRNFEDLCKNAKIVNCVCNTIKDYGKANGLTKREIPFRMKLCSDEWTTDNGFLSAAMKVKRIVIMNHYKKEVDEMFGNDINNN